MAADETGEILAITANAWATTGTGGAAVSTKYSTGAVKDVSSLT